MIASAARYLTFVLLCAAVVLAQNSYDNLRASYELPDKPPSATLVRAFDLGLDAAAASFAWINVRPELPFLPQGPQHFLDGLDLVNDLNPRWSTPYAFTVLVLPSVREYSGRLSAALAVGERGVAQADPNWQIPFYMGTIYQLELNDRQAAARYFDLAATTPGVPELIRRFALNYGIRPDRLAETRAIWLAIRDSSEDPAVRERAEAHVAHLEILEYLNQAVQVFHERHGVYPDDIEALVTSGVISEIPASPFGFSFKLYEDGVVGIAP